MVNILSEKIHYTVNTLYHKRILCESMCYHRSKHVIQALVGKAQKTTTQQTIIRNVREFFQHTFLNMAMFLAEYYECLFFRWNFPNEGILLAEYSV